MYSYNDINLNFSEQLDEELWEQAKEKLMSKFRMRSYETEEPSKDDIQWEYLKLRESLINKLIWLISE